jgi:hypothetical protein
MDLLVQPTEAVAVEVLPTGEVETFQEELVVLV